MRGVNLWSRVPRKLLHHGVNFLTHSLRDFKGTHSVNW